MIRDRRLWTSDEDKAIQQLVGIYGNKNWAFISQKMQEDYKIQYRSGKQCRQRWINHLNPDVNKDKWTDEEEEKVFLNYLRYGNKWKQISQHFPGRTDNCIKNHFYSTLRRSLRRINKFVGIRNSTQKMRQIKPSILSKMLDSTINSQEVGVFKDFAQILFEFSSFKPNKDNIGVMNELISKKYKKNITEVLIKINELNENYSKQRQVKPLRKRKQTKPPKKQVKFQQICKQQQSQQYSSDELLVKHQQCQSEQNQKQQQILSQNDKYDYEQNCQQHDGHKHNYKKTYYKFDQKSQNFEHYQFDEDESEFKDLTIIGKPIKLTQIDNQQVPIQDGEIFEMLFTN